MNLEYIQRLIMDSTGADWDEDRVRDMFENAGIPTGLVDAALNSGEYLAAAGSIAIDFVAKSAMVVVGPAGRLITYVCGPIAEYAPKIAPVAKRILLGGGTLEKTAKWAIYAYLLDSLITGAGGNIGAFTRALTEYTFSFLGSALSYIPIVGPIINALGRQVIYAGWDTFCSIPGYAVGVAKLYSQLLVLGAVAFPPLHMLESASWRKENQNRFLGHNNTITDNFAKDREVLDGLITKIGNQCQTSIGLALITGLQSYYDWSSLEIFTPGFAGYTLPLSAGYLSLLCLGMGLGTNLASWKLVAAKAAVPVFPEIRENHQDEVIRDVVAAGFFTIH